MTCKINLLYWGTGPLGKNEKITTHRHDFCQLELSIKGTCACKVGKENFSCSAFEAIFIPQGHTHSFVFGENLSDTQYYSFKFRVSDGSVPPAPVKIPRDYFSEWVADCLCRLLGNETGPFKYNPRTAELLETLLNSLLEHYTSRFVPQSPLPPFLEHLRMEVAQYGAKLSVKRAAEHAGLSVIQFRYRFAAETAQLPQEEKYSTPGKFIDSLLAETAAIHLKNPKLRIQNIAAVMRFNNNYTFSRFFHRMTGMSPTEYRKQFIDQP